MCIRDSTNPLVWGEDSWLWPSMRMDILSRLRLGTLGDVEADEKFSAGGWLMLRLKPGNIDTGDGSLFSRMGDAKRRDGAGWEIYQEKQHFVVNLVPAREAASASKEPEAVPAPAGDKDKEDSDGKAAEKPKRGISVATKRCV